MSSNDTRNKTDIYWIIAVLFIVAKLCIHLLTSTNYELHRDEMLYINMADHLSFGFATVPPLTGFLAFLVKCIFGNSVFGIRLIPALFGAASIFIIARIIKELNGGIVALVVAATSFLLSTGFLLFDTLFTPNATEQFLWLLSTYLIWRMISQNNPKLWITIGIVLGVAFLNKYSVMFFILGFFISLLFSQHRKVFNTRYFYYAILAGAVIILPNLIWQYKHGWPVIFHMSELKRTQLDNLTYKDFFIDLFSLNLTSSFIWATGLVSLIFIKKERTNQFIGIASLLIILLFLFSKGKAYYVLGLIPFLFAYGGFTLEKYLKGSSVFVIYIILLISVTFSIIALPFGIPLFSFDKLESYQAKTKNMIVFPFYRWEDGRAHTISQVYADMTGWKELTNYVTEAYSLLSKDEQGRCTIYVESDYGNTGAINFYGKANKLPDAISFHESYTIWAPDTVPDGPFIYVNGNQGDIRKLFNRVTEIGTVEDSYARDRGLMVFLCTDPIVNVREVYRQRAGKEKKLFQRE
jgi:hypothetical protein